MGMRRTFFSILVAFVALPLPSLQAVAQLAETRAMLVALLSSPPATKAELFAFTGTLFADGSISPEENAVVRALVRGDGTVEISGEALALPVLPEAFRPTLRYVVEPPLFPGMWANDHAGFDQLVEISRLAPTTRLRVLQFMVSQLRTAWQSSHPGDYSPFVNALASLAARSDAMDEDTRPLARLLVYDAAQTLDRGFRDEIPDGHYTAICPEKQGEVNATPLCA